MIDPTDTEQLSALASILRAQFGNLVMAESEMEAAIKGLTDALRAGRDSRRELDAVEAVAASWLMITEGLRALVDPLATLLDNDH